jgi:hypothetical protein
MTTRSVPPPNTTSQVRTTLQESVTGQDRRSAFRAALDLAPDCRLRNPALPIRRK